MSTFAFGTHKLCSQCKGTGKHHVLNRKGKRVRYTEKDAKTKRWVSFPCNRCFGTGIERV